MVLALGSVVLSSSDFPWVCFQQSSFQTNSPCLVAEGGATGGRAGATARRKEKADVEQKLLFGLQQWLASCVQDSASGSRIDPKEKGKGKSREDTQNLVRKSNNDEGLVSAWEPLVIRAKKNPGGLLKRLQELVRAVADSRFCTKQQPGPFARKWCSSVALWILCGYIEGHCI